MEKKTLFAIGISALVIAALAYAWSLNQKNSDPDFLGEHSRIQLHIHPSLEIEILNQQFPVPQYIGITKKGMMVIHTHTADGILHVESPEPRTFYLADFFRIWGQNFNSTCIFDYCSDDNHTLNVYVNDQESNLYENIVLKDKDRIKIVYAEAQK